MTGILVLSVSAAVIGSSTQFGYNTGVINSPKQVHSLIHHQLQQRLKFTGVQAIYNSFNNNESHLYANFSSLGMTFAVAIFAIGGMLGALPAGLIADHLGRYHWKEIVRLSSLFSQPPGNIPCC